jgi:hypothetical protein
MDYELEELLPHELPPDPYFRGAPPQVDHYDELDELLDALDGPELSGAALADAERAWAANGPAVRRRCKKRRKSTEVEACWSESPLFASYLSNLSVKRLDVETCAQGGDADTPTTTFIRALELDAIDSQLSELAAHVSRSPALLSLSLEASEASEVSPDVLLQLCGHLQRLVLAKVSQWRRL